MVSMGASDLWRELEAGEARTYGTLRVVPLIGRSSAEPSYGLFDGEGDVEITEVSKDGDIPNIRVRNRREDRVLLIDGQELIGAKQNRILNVDVLVAAGAEVVIPVSCVEQGRWYDIAGVFSPGKMMHYAARVSKAEDVARALRADYGPRANQLKVWNKVQALLGELHVASPSAAMNDAYEQREKDLAGIRAAFELPPETIGVAVYDGDRFLGLDVFDRATTFAHHWKSLVDSYTLDWLAFSDRRGKAPGSDGPAPPVDKLLETLAGAEWDRFDTPGEGDDMRWEDERLTASALVWGGNRVVHLQAFPRRGS